MVSIKRKTGNHRCNNVSEGMLELVPSLKRNLKKLAILALSAFFSSMTIYSSGFAAFITYELNIIVTPDNARIIWPSEGLNGQPANYSEPTKLTSAELLLTFVCQAGTNCTSEALAAGAVYYKTEFIDGVGYVVFFYDALGNLVGTQLKSEFTYDVGEEESLDTLVPEPEPPPRSG